MSAAIAITGGRVVCPATGHDGIATILLKDRKIAGIGQAEPPSDAQIIDATGLVVAPGLIDAGVFRADTAAANAGGITRMILMPDQSPPLDDPALVAFAQGSGKPDVWVHPLAAATRGLEGRELAELALMQDAGAKAVATGRRWIADSGVMLRLLQYAAMLGMVVVTHAEDSGLTGDAAATAGEIATRLGLPAAPAEAEALAIARDIALAELAGARLHIRQVTTARGFDLVREAKARGLAVTCGITPAHFLLSDLATADFRTFTRLSPPLRAEADRQAALVAIADGTVDVIASGHDPRGPEDKRLPFADAASGMAGAETLLAMVLGLVRDDVIDTPRAFELTARNPARLLGVPAGELAAGLEADFALIDADAPWIIDRRKMEATADNTPFDRQGTQGRVLGLWKGGARLVG